MASSGLAAPLVSPMASIGVPREIKRDEQRVALTPDGVRELVSQGMEVRIEAGAGHGGPGLGRGRRRCRWQGRHNSRAWPRSCSARP